MYAREKRDASKGTISHHSDITELFNMLQSSDERTVEEVKSLIQENLAAKDSELLPGLIEFFVAVQSTRALDILVRVREPQAKSLFDVLIKYMKNESTRNNALLLLSHLVYRQPPWLYKITQNRVMSELITILKSETDSPNLVCALLTIVSLLPMFPSQFGPYLSDLFEVFTRLAAWNTKKPSVVPEVYVLHLQVGVYNLFLRLYGLFPCNFLAYLRSFYGGRDFNEENHQVFCITIKPMLERVRLHPLLVTASKESEVSLARWKKMETHDVLTECAKISLDATEGSNESSGHYRSSAYSSGFSVFATGSSMQDSTQYVSLSSQSSTVSVTLDPGSLVNTAVTSSQEAMWTPSHACGISTPPIVQPQYELSEPIKSSRHLSTQTSISGEINAVLDIAQEAKPESLKNELPTSKHSSKVTQQDLQNANDEQNVDVAEEAQALEEREEDVADKEVSDLTSKTQNQPDEECRQTTPFCFTTQNLTDEPLAMSKNSENLPEQLDEDAAEDLELSTETECEIRVENFVKNLNRIRFLSHCGLPPDVPVSPSRSVPLHRSRSWPSIRLDEYVHKNLDCKTMPKPLVTKTSLPPNLDQHPPTCGFVSLDTSVQNEGMPTQTICSEITPIDHLIPMATSLPVKVSTFVTSSYTYSTEQTSCNRGVDHSFRNSLSPVELLDRHLQLGSETYINQLNFIPITSTDNTNWTHFGGQPPADEIVILRKQISMLHSQLLFERHLREIHGERNRRLLGKAKWSRMQEEYTAALKDQVQLLEKENKELKQELGHQCKLYHQLQKEKLQSENVLEDCIRKLQQENSSSAIAHRKLQGLLVFQKEDYDKLMQKYKDCQLEVLDTKYELELSHREIVRCQKLEKEVTWLAKELVLLQELNLHYKEKLDVLKTPQLPEVELDLVRDATHSEMTGLKQMLESKTTHLDVAKSKISELELLLSNMKLKLAEQKEIVESLRSAHKDEIMAREERIAELCRINQQKEAHILELYHDQELLALEMKNPKSVKNLGSGNIASSSVELAPCASGIQENATVPEGFEDPSLT